jgi:hypothetical protein
MGAGERVEFHAATEHGQNRLYRLRHLPLCWFALYFSINTALNPVFFLLRYPHVMYLLLPLKFAARNNALSMLRGGLSCLLQKAILGSLD